jgi:hypothetical protein
MGLLIVLELIILEHGREEREKSLEVSPLLDLLRVVRVLVIIQEALLVTGIVAPPTIE